MVRRERLRGDGSGNGPPGALVILVVLLVAAAVIWVTLR